VQLIRHIDGKKENQEETMPFQAPIGTIAERATGRIWPGSWADATGFAVRYEIGIHTGADLNMPADQDAHTGVYAIGDGTVTYAQRYPDPNVWGNIVVVDHGLVDGKPLFSRYAHVENLCVAANQPVKMGEQLAFVGNAFGLFAFHLHFDISTTAILKDKPWNWPAGTKNPDPSLVRAQYVDPQQWLLDHFGEGAVPSGRPAILVPDAAVKGKGGQAAKITGFVIAAANLEIRDKPRTAGKRLDILRAGERVKIAPGNTVKDGLNWGRIADGPHKGGWITLGTADKRVSYVKS
jgi:murein DD-endopeptidase MepM/ murein hydrolase activator NlpD